MVPVPASSWFDLSATGRGRVVLSSILVTLGCIIISFAISSTGLDPFSRSPLATRLVVNVVAPIVIAFPVMYFLMSKMRELAVAHRELQIIASTDSLTTTLSRGAFTMLVDAYLERAEAQSSHQGALLVVDADNFKSINDSFGHDGGDEALKLIATSIKGVLRSGDIVGRIGGDEFGVFLPGSSPTQAEAAAERIRASVSAATFRAASGRIDVLSVSVGGATFTRKMRFDQLFKAADLRLFDAKHEGRNRVLVAPAYGYAAAA